MKETVLCLAVPLLAVLVNAAPVETDLHASGLNVQQPSTRKAPPLYDILFKKATNEFGVHDTFDPEVFPWPSYPKWQNYIKIRRENPEKFDTELTNTQAPSLYDILFKLATNEFGAYDTFDPEVFSWPSYLKWRTYLKSCPGNPKKYESELFNPTEAVEVFRQDPTVFDSAPREFWNALSLFLWDGYLHDSPAPAPLEEEFFDLVIPGFPKIRRIELDSQMALDVYRRFPAVFANAKYYHLEVLLKRICQEYLKLPSNRPVPDTLAQDFFKILPEQYPIEVYKVYRKFPTWFENAPGEFWDILFAADNIDQEEFYIPSGPRSSAVGYAKLFNPMWDKLYQDASEHYRNFPEKFPIMPPALLHYICTALVFPGTMQMWRNVSDNFLLNFALHENLKNYKRMRPAVDQLMQMKTYPGTSAATEEAIREWRESDKYNGGKPNLEKWNVGGFSSYVQ